MLLFETLDFIKTYSAVEHVTDSAAASTALHTGIKTANGVLNLAPSAIYSNCSSGTGKDLFGIPSWAQEAGKAVGFVTTTRVTHSTPAALYARLADREWECENDLKRSSGTEKCKDIAWQLVNRNIYFEMNF